MSSALDIDPRAWRESLGLSEEEAAGALDMSTTRSRADRPTNGAMRFREWERGKGEPSAPTLRLMDTTAKVVEALALLREGRADEARRVLQRTMTGALMRTVRERVPGVEAVGPARDQSA